MRITFVVPVLESGGGARIVAGHAKRLAQRGHRVSIVVPVPEPLSLRQRIKILLGREKAPSDPAKAHTAQAGVPIIHVPRDRLSDPNSYPDADIIVATFWVTAEWIMPLPSSKGTKVHFLQGYEAFPNIPAERVDAVWQLPTKKIAIAQWLIDLGHERFGLEHISLVPNSIDHDSFNCREKRIRTEPRIGFLYSNAISKDMPSALAAVAQVKKQMPHVGVVSFGSSKPDRSFPTYIDFTYLPSQEKIAQIYRQSTVWLSTSLSEGFNLPPLEAMATGCPAVCSKTGRPLEIIRDGLNGYLVEQGDVDGFVNAMLKVLSLPEAGWEAMSNHAIESVAQPTWDESSRLFEDALKAMV